MQEKAQHPNNLRKLLALAGLNQREAARESGVPEGTLRHYVAGSQVIPRRDRIKLARVLGCGIQDLAPQYDLPGNSNTRGIKQTMTESNVINSAFAESDSGFSFGTLKTTWTVLDGDGIAEYTPFLEFFFGGRYHT